MTLVRLALALLVLAAALPEIPRYVAERRLYQASAMLRSVLARPHAVPNPGGVIAWAGSVAAGVAGDLPGDWRPLNVAGSALLLTRQPERALERYREALGRGERPEIDLNAGRAYASLGRHDLARAAFVRAGWISPAVLASLPGPTREAIGPELADLEVRLTRGQLAAVPAFAP